MLAAAIVNNDSFPVFVVYGRVANPCKYVLSMLLSPLNRYTYPSSIARYGVTTKEAVRPKCSPTNAELGPYS